MRPANRAIRNGRIRDLLDVDRNPSRTTGLYLSCGKYSRTRKKIQYNRRKVKTVVCNYGLFTVKDDKIFFSDSLNRRMLVLEEKRAKRSEAGRLGNAARWKTSQTDRNAITMRSQFIASKVKKSKEKESIGKESMRGKRKPFSPPTPSEVESFFTENGYTAEAARRAFDYYTDANWHDAEGKPVLNWKQKMRGVWFKPEHKQPSGMDLKIPL